MSDMEEIAISKFKATCLAVLERVRKTGEPIRVTRFGKPVAEIVPPAADKPKKRVLGAMAGTVIYPDDLVEAPALQDDEWEFELLKEWDELEALGKSIEARNLKDGAREPHQSSKRQSKRETPS